MAGTLSKLIEIISKDQFEEIPHMIYAYSFFCDFSMVATWHCFILCALLAPEQFQTSTASMVTIKLARFITGPSSHGKQASVTLEGI